MGYFASCTTTLQAAACQEFRSQSQISERQNFSPKSNPTQPFACTVHEPSESRLIQVIASYRGCHCRAGVVLGWAGPHPAGCFRTSTCSK